MTEKKENNTYYFDPGKVMCTKAIDCRIKDDENFKKAVLESLEKYLHLNFGAIVEDDIMSNLEDIKNGCCQIGGGRVLARYHTNGEPDTNQNFQPDDIYIQTQREVDTLYTLIMFTGEY